MQNLRIFKDMEANCENCPFNITEGDIKKCYNDCGDKPNECYKCNYLEYYLKTDADKVIAKKQEAIDNLGNFVNFLMKHDLIKDCPEKETVKAMLPLIKA